MSPRSTASSDNPCLCTGALADSPALSRDTSGCLPVCLMQRANSWITLEEARQQLQDAKATSCTLANFGSMCDIYIQTAIPAVLSDMFTEYNDHDLLACPQEPCYCNVRNAQNNTSHHDLPKALIPLPAFNSGFNQPLNSLCSVKQRMQRWCVGHYFQRRAAGRRSAALTGIHRGRHAELVAPRLRRQHSEFCFRHA